MGTPFVAKAFLRSPVIMTPYTTLDALLAAAVVKERGGDWTPPVDIPLDKDPSGSVYLASSWTGSPVIATQEATFYRRLEPNLFVEASDGAKHNYDVMQGIGPFRLFAVPYTATLMAEIVFCGKGDPERTRVLLVRHISALGAMRGKGLGSVRLWTVTPTKKDESLVRNGRPARPLPIDLAEKLGVTGPTILYQTRAPYWDRGGVLCAAPLWPWPEPDYSITTPSREPQPATTASLSPDSGQNFDMETSSAQV